MFVRKVNGRSGLAQVGLGFVSGSAFSNRSIRVKITNLHLTVSKSFILLIVRKEVAHLYTVHFFKTV